MATLYQVPPLSLLMLYQLFYSNRVFRFLCWIVLVEIQYPVQVPYSWFSYRAKLVRKCLLIVTIAVVISLLTFCICSKVFTATSFAEQKFEIVHLSVEFSPNTYLGFWIFITVWTFFFEFCWTYLWFFICWQESDKALKQLDVEDKGIYWKLHQSHHWKGFSDKKSRTFDVLLSKVDLR